VYLALEGQAGFDDRAEAFSQHNLEPGKKVPAFKLCGATLDLVKEHLQLIAEIRAQSSSPGCIVIDTMNRSLVGSESKDEDMAAYIRAADVLPQAFGCLIVIIHHCGVDETRPRGHTSQTGAADVQISVKKETGTSVVTATVELAKDMGEGTTIASRLKVVELGPDQDEDQITTCVVLPVEEAAAATQGKGSSKAKKLAPQTVTALKAIKEAITETGIVPPESNHIPPNTKGVTKDQWRDYAHRREICPISTREGKTSEEAEWLLKEAQRKAFSRACAELTAAGQVGCWNDFYWLTKE
jgi:AAA domain